jgi:hypothetical protein
MSDALDILTALRASSALLERAQLEIVSCDDLSDDMRDDLAYHTRNNRVHVDLTAGRLHAVIAHGGDLE